MIIVSSCLAGRSCRYDGTAKPNERVMRMVREGFALPVCAEELGGLPTPRKPCEIIGGDGMDVLDGKAYVQTEDRIKPPSLLRVQMPCLHLQKNAV